MGVNNNTVKEIRWISWDKLTIPKHKGGMGFKRLGVFNLSMVGKQDWNLISNPDAFLSQVLKAKYEHSPSYS